MLPKLKKPLQAFLGLMLMTSVSGCALNGQSDYCLIAKPIVLNQSVIELLDDDAVNQILEHNEKFSAVCGTD